MAESFLVEQLNRIRAMAERMSQARESVQDVSEQILRDLELMRPHPLYQVRDLRTAQSYDPLDAPPSRFATSRSGSRRRRRE